MERASPTALLTLVFLGAAAGLARSDIDVELANGNSLRGTLAPAGDVEVLRVRIPEGALLSVTAKGLKRTGGTAPNVSFRVLDATDADVAAGRVTPKGATGSAVRKLAIEASGEYRVEVRGDGVATGDYLVKAAWKSPTRLVAERELSGGEVAVELAADAGASATLSVKPGRGSAARPRLLRLERVADGEVIGIVQPDAAASAHKSAGVPLSAGGDYRLVLGDAGGGGSAKVTIVLKPPKAARTTIDVTGAVLGSGGGDRALGSVLGALGGLLSLPAADPSGLGGSSLLLPTGALGGPTALVIASAPPIDAAPSPDVRRAGPTVSFGPDGQRFLVSVTVTIPFAAAAFAGDFSSLVVVQRDGSGRTSVVPGPYTVDEVLGTVSFAASHFTAYRAFGRLPPVSSDLNDDGRPDLVYLDPDPTVGEPNRVRVVLGGPSLATRAIDERDVVFQGTTENDFFGQAIAVGDVDGDGVDDLLIGAQEAAATEGRVFVFLGGSSFAGSLDAETDADVVLRGDGGLARLGASIALGQFVGDATLDVVVGTNNSSPFEAPEVFVFEGGAALASGAVPAVTVTGPRNEAFASRVAAADVSGDGNADLLIASSFGVSFERGAVYVFFGGAGFANAAHTDADVTLTGSGDGERFGSSLAAGDLVGDAAADVAVGTSRFGSPVESVFVFAGGAGLASGTSAGADAVVSGEVDVTSEFFGSVLAVANVGGDPRADLVVGDRFLASGGSNPGGVAVFLGGAAFQSGGLGAADFLIAGEAHADLFGGFVAAQDLVGDGVAELIVTAPLHPGPGALRGTLYVFTGGTPFPANAALADIALTGLDFGD